mgnify:CR=1 FL=1|tara:strand:+ start:220 stop:438 length:219 start_codon:yes stop_codon:yes gene_type:complete
MLWLNTALYNNQKIENVFNLNIDFIRQRPEQVDIYDDKYLKIELLKKSKIPVSKIKLISIKHLTDYVLAIDF